MTPGAVWSHRALLALDDADFETQRRERQLMREIMQVCDMAWRPTGLDLVDTGDGSGHRTWGQHPHRGDVKWGRRREAELWDEIGELLGIGPRPRSMGLLVDAGPGAATR